MNRFSVEIADRLIALLYDGGDRAIGLDELASSVGADKAAVGAALKAVEARGHRLERVPTRGVQLVRPTVMDAHLIERDLPVKHIGRHVVCFGEVGSTNDVAFDSAGQAGDDAVVITAEHQRAGRGRFGRQWISPAGSGVLASALVQAGVSLPHEELTIAAGLAVAEGVEQAAGVRATLAWPNDVLIDSAKVAGVIVEVRDGRMVIGFGINVNAAPPGEDVGQRVTCLSAEAHGPLERIDVCRAVLTCLDGWVEHLSGGSTEELHRRWLGRCGMPGKRMRFRSAGQTFTARVLDLSPLDGLRVFTDDGRRLDLHAAETSVLGPAGPDA